MPWEPGIHLLLGPPNAGKLGRVLDWWERHRDAGALLVAPTWDDARALGRELVERKGVVIGEPPVVTFDQLAATVAGQGGPILGRFSRELLVRRLLEGLPDGPLGSLAGLPGTPGAVGDLLDDLADSGLAPDQMEAALERWAEGDPDGVPGELVRLAAAFQAALDASGHTERRRVVATAAAGATGWARPVACYGFSSFTPGQRRLLVALSADAPVLLSLLSPPASAGVPGVERSWWEGRARSVEQLELQPRSFSSLGLDAFNRRWLGEDVSPGPVEDDRATGVRLLVSAGRRNEVELVAREIVELLRRDFGPGEIVVAAAGLEPYRLLLSQVFGRYAIPFRIDGHVPLGKTGLGQALLAGLRGLDQGSYEDLFAFLRSPYAPVPQGTVDRLELALHRSRRLAGEGMLEIVRRRLDGDLGPLEAVFAPAEPGVHFDAAALVSLTYGMLARAVQAAGRSPSELEQDARAVRALERALQEAESARGTGLLPAGLSLSQLHAALGRLRVPLGGEEAGVVQVAPLHRIRARRCSALFVLGLVEGEFPSPGPERGLLGPEARRAANVAAGVDLFREHPPEEDDELFALAVSRPWQLLVLSTRDAEEDGGEALPSPFYVRARDLLPKGHLQEGKDLDEVVHEAARAPSEREYLRAAAVVDADLAGLADLDLLPPWRRSPRIVSAALRAELRSRQVFSPGELETHASCPFRWFVQQVVRLEEIEREFDARSRGTLAHDVLRDVYLGLRTEKLLPLGEEGLPRAEALLDRHLARHLGRLAAWADPGELRLIEAEARRLLAALLAFDAAAGSVLAPLLVEHTVGARGGVDIGGLRIRGRVDRVDAGRDGDPILVVDYKSGKAPHMPFARHTALQVPLYLLALRAERPGVRLAGGLYASLTEGRATGLVSDEWAGAVGGWAAKVVSPEDFEAELQASLEKARETAEAIRAGVIDAEPPEGCPRFCDLAPVCRSGRRPAEV